MEYAGEAHGCARDQAMPHARHPKRLWWRLPRHQRVVEAVLRDLHVGDACKQQPHERENDHAAGLRARMGRGCASSAWPC